MAAEYPTSVGDYCKRFKIPFDQLCFPCLFCKTSLTTLQLNSFVHKQLSLVWKSGVCHACCNSCLKITARYECQNYFQCYVSGSLIEDFLGIPLWDLIVRCLECLSKLSYVEKLDCICAGEKFYLVRGHWRSFCRECLLKR